MAVNTKDTPLSTRARTITQVPTSLTTATRTRTTTRSTLVQTNQGDFPIYEATKTISGTIYTLSGAPASGATVKLVRQVDDKVVQVGVSNALGQYVFIRDSQDTYAYYVIGYTSATSPQIHGVSDRGGVPA